MIKLIVDSTSEISKEEAESLGLKIIPMKVTIDEKEYLVGENLSTEEFFEKLSNCKSLPKTTQINSEEYIEAIKPILENGDEVFVMCLSSGLSGSFNSLRIAYENLKSDKVRIFDTETTTFAYKALVMEAINLINLGVSLDELEKELNILKSKIRIYAVIDNIKYLIKGGRLSYAKGIVATALNIKPIVTIKNKKVEMLTKSVGFSLGMKTICKLINNVDFSKGMYYGHANDKDKATKLKNLIYDKLGIEFKNICGIGPIIGTHVGQGCVGVVYFEK